MTVSSGPRPRSPRRCDDLGFRARRSSRTRLVSGSGRVGECSAEATPGRRWTRSHHTRQSVLNRRCGATLRSFSQVSSISRSGLDWAVTPAPTRSQVSSPSPMRVPRTRAASRAPAVLPRSHGLRRSRAHGGTDRRLQRVSPRPDRPGPHGAAHLNRGRAPASRSHRVPRAHAPAQRGLRRRVRRGRHSPPPAGSIPISPYVTTISFAVYLACRVVGGCRVRLRGIRRTSPVAG